MKDGYDAAVVGLGRLGLPLSAVLAGAGNRVIGVDCDASKVAAVNAKEAPFPEPGLDQLLQASADRLIATTDLAYAVTRAAVVFVLVNTPSDADGLFSLREVLPVVEGIGRALRDIPTKPLLVISSTLTPGSMTDAILPMLEQAADCSVPRDFGLCYLPEMVAIGQIVRDYQRPDLVVIGSFCANDADRLQQFLEPVHYNNPPMHVLDPTGAELAKLAINTFVATKITFANLIAWLGDKLHVPDMGAVSKAISSDRRIGERFFRPGTPFGGPCFPRDVRAFTRICELKGVSGALPRSVDTVNGLLFQKIVEAANAPHKITGRIAVLGLEFKPGSGVVTGSPGIEIIRRLALSSRPLFHDPYLSSQYIDGLGLDADMCASLEELVTLATVFVLANPDAALARELDRLLAEKPDCTVIDPWRLLQRNSVFHKANH